MHPRMYRGFVDYDTLQIYFLLCLERILRTQTKVALLTFYEIVKQFRIIAEVSCTFSYNLTYTVFQSAHTVQEHAHWKTTEYVFLDVPCVLLAEDDLVRDDNPELLREEMRL